MAATKNHDYHLVDPDPWPLIGAICCGLLFSGLVMWWHENAYGKFVFALSGATARASNSPSPFSHAPSPAAASHSSRPSIGIA